MLALMAIAGCSDPNVEKRGEVMGTVTLDGQPVADGAISFFPIGATSGPSAGGKIVNGKYHIPQAQGPVIGDNRVEFNGALFPDKYNMQPHSTIQVHVEPGVNTFDFLDLKSK
jgi:hypothetical protein